MDDVAVAGAIIIALKNDWPWIVIVLWVLCIALFVPEILEARRRWFDRIQKNKTVRQLQLEQEDTER